MTAEQFAYLVNVTSDVQAQLNGKAALVGTDNGTWAIDLDASSVTTRSLFFGLAANYLKYDITGTNFQLSHDLTFPGAQTVDGVDVSEHTHSGAAGHGPNIPESSVTNLVDDLATLNEEKVSNRPNQDENYFNLLPFSGMWDVEYLPTVDVSATGLWDDDRVSDPWIAREDDTWYLYYWGAKQGVDEMSISYATSADLKNWTKADPAVADPSDVTVFPQSAPSWCGAVNTPGLIKIGETWYMWFTGSAGGTKKLGYATADSLDGTWTDSGAAILEGGSDGDDTTIDLMAPSPYYDAASDTYYLFYSGSMLASEDPDQYIWKIYYSTSPDGLVWTRQGPAFAPSDNVADFDYGWIGAGSIIRVGEYYIMAYNAGSDRGETSLDEDVASGIGLAWTTDISLATDTWHKYQVGGLNKAIVASGNTDTFKNPANNIWRAHLVNLQGEPRLFFNAGELNGTIERTFYASPSSIAKRIFETTGAGTSVVEGMKHANRTSATAGVTREHSPAVTLSGHAWVSGADQEQQFRTYVETSTIQQPVWHLQSRLGTGSWTDLILARGDGQWMSPINFLTYNPAQAINNMLYFLGDGDVAIGQSRTSPTVRFSGVGWKTGMSTYSRAGFEMLQSPQNGADSCKSTLLLRAGVNTYIPDTDWGVMQYDGTNKRFGVGTTAPEASIDTAGNSIRIATSRTPSSASDTGVAGEICWDANYIYICTATNTWKRAAISTW